MKNTKFLSIFLFLAVTSFLYADENYKNGNGTLIFQDTSDEKSIEVRKFELKNVEIADQLEDINTVYKSYEKTEST